MIITDDFDRLVTPIIKKDDQNGGWYVCDITLSLRYKTEEQAHEAVKKFRAINILHMLAQEFNPPDWKPNWKDEYQPKFAIFYEHGLSYGIPSSLYIRECYTCESIETVYFATKESARKAIQILKKECDM